MKVNVKEIVPYFVGQIDDFPFDAIDEQVIQELRAAWTQYPVMRFRNVKIGDREQVAFSRALCHVGFGTWIGTKPTNGDGVQRAVGGSIATSVQPMSGHLT